MREDYNNAISNNFNVENTQGVLLNVNDEKERLNENYTNKDLNWNTSTHSGDIYISTPDDTHNLIVNHHNHMNDADYDGRYNLPENGGYPGVSGFFTNEDTASKSFNEDGSFDSVKLGNDLQQSPYFDDYKAEIAKENGETYKPEYNGHLDCFRVNPEKMQENYGTTDFYAAMSSCTENKAWGNGSGFQGYNSCLNEMINNGSLGYVPENSRSCNSNICEDYSDRKRQASSEASAVNNYIKDNDVKGNPGERLGYNQLSQNSNLDNINNADSNNMSSSNIVSATGGGARAPNNLDRELSQSSNNISSNFNPDDYIPKTPAADATSKVISRGIE